ncbi:pyrimidine 5'-nucleotidase [Sneathiella sp.]|jgi:putative hydrolase of the HAD superfamily|uniref:pyrimidine 5'-nucleotidase n=1 Tax=Sneathiella sp. TaxID=1964365 RepID=UPI0039E3963E
MEQKSNWSDFSDIDTWIFDLDNTLYPAHCNLFAQIDQKMGDFVADFLKVDHAEAKKIQKHYFQTYGTTLNGLMKCHDMHPDDFLAFVHDIDVSEMARAEKLDAALHELNGRKIIFTNGSDDHATNVSRQLGIDHHFDHIFDIRKCDFIPKPEISVYHKMIDELDITPSRAVFFEDMAKNLKPAHDLGMTTVWVPNEEHWSSETSEGPHIHHIAEDLPDWLHRLLASRP